MCPKQKRKMRAEQLRRSHSKYDKLPACRTQAGSLLYLIAGLLDAGKYHQQSK